MSVCRATPEGGGGLDPPAALLDAFISIHMPMMDT